MSTEASEFLEQDAGPFDDERIEPDTYQIAQASDPAEVVAVDLPGNAQVLVIPVRGGEIIRLPTDSEAGLLAEIGPEGNLGIVVDGRTIVLQGYVAAQNQEPITITTSDGDIVDIADVVAATDPSIDIQTAAGPAAGPQGDAAADGGNGIYTPFLAGPALGGFDASGVLGGTALAYGLINDQPANFDFEDRAGDEEDETETPEEPEEPGLGEPNANPDAATAPSPVVIDYQLMLVIDISESMGEEVTRPDGTTTTRMELQRAAIESLLDAYVAATSGTVSIKAVTFSADAAYFGGTGISTFVDVSDPAALAAFLTALDALAPTTNTDYDAALSTAQRGIMDASWIATDASTQGLVYFFSDGRPTETDAGSPYPSGSSDNSISLTEENLWEGRTSAGAFTTGLADKGVIAIAIGHGGDIAGDATALAQLGRVAYTSEAVQDGPVIVVDQEAQLPVEVSKTAPATVTGNVLGNDDAGPDGYDSPPIVAISAVLDADTISQTTIATATGFEIETNNGVLSIDTTTGDFIYTAKPGSNGNSDVFNYTIRDAVGPDTDSATLTISVTPSLALT